MWPARMVVDDDVADQVRILAPEIGRPAGLLRFAVGPDQLDLPVAIRRVALDPVVVDLGALVAHAHQDPTGRAVNVVVLHAEDRTGVRDLVRLRSEEHTSELQSLMRISYAVFCL